MSDISLTAAMRSNLTSLQNVASLMDRTQLRLSTGKAVNSVVDDPVKYFTSQNLSQRAGLLDGVKAGIGNALSALNAADTGIKAIKSTLANMESLVTQARNLAGKTDADSNAKRADLVKQFNSALDQINNIVKDSSFNGINFLKASTQLKVAFNEETGSNATSLTIKGFDAEFTALGSASGAAGNVTVSQTANTTTASLGGVGSVVAKDGATLAASEVEVTLGNTKVKVTNFGGTPAAGDVTITLSSGGTVNLAEGSTVTDGNVRITRATGGDVTVQYDDNGDGAFNPNTTTGDDEIQITFASGLVVSTINGTATNKTTTVTMTNTTGAYTVGVNDGTAGAGSIGGGSGAGLAKLSEADSTGADMDSDTKLDALVAKIGSARSYLDQNASRLAGNVATLNTRDNFLKEMINTLKSGSDKLTAADMNEEGANMLALQTRQQLGITSLSLASQAMQGVLRLF